MEDDIFAATDAAIARANGSTDPEVVVEFNRSKVFVGSPLIGSIIGMSFRYSTLGVISVNRNLDLVWRMFAYWHELAHVFRGHIDDPGFGYHQDRGLFSVPVDSRAISRQEREANIISAEYNISTEDVLDLISYENQTMKDYRELKRKQEETARAYDKLRFSADSTAMIRYRLDEKRQDLESEMVSMNCVKSISEIAGELNTSEVILKYKLEAMRLRGYDIDVAELERYDQVFKDAR